MANRPIRRGDLFWATPDGGGSIPAHRHPHLVLQDDLFNFSRVHSVVVCALTTNLKRGAEPGNILLDEGEGGLTKRSVVVVSQLSAIAKEHLGERIGALSDARVEQALTGLRFQQRAFLRGR